MSVSAMADLIGWLRAESSRGCAIRHVSGRYVVSLSDRAGAYGPLDRAELEAAVFEALAGRERGCVVTAPKAVERYLETASELLTLARLELQSGDAAIAHTALQQAERLTAIALATLRGTPERALDGEQA